MNDRVTKNYSKDGGDTLVIGGKLVIEEGAEVEGLGGGGGDLPIASAETLGGVKVGANLSIDENGVLSADNQAPGIASADTAGVVKIGSNLSIDENGVLSADSQTPNAATTEAAGIVKMAENQADSQGSNLLALEAAFNNLLAKLKAAGIMAPDAESEG